MNAYSGNFYTTAEERRQYLLRGLPKPHKLRSLRSQLRSIRSVGRALEEWLAEVACRSVAGRKESAYKAIDQKKLLSIRDVARRRMSLLTSPTKEHYIKNRSLDNRTNRFEGMVRAMSDDHLASSTGFEKAHTQLTATGSMYLHQTAEPNKLDYCSVSDDLSADTDVDKNGDVVNAHQSEASCWTKYNDFMTSLIEDVDKYRRSLVWTRVFAACDEMMRKKKNGLKRVISGTSKLLKSTTRGVYLAAVIYKDGKLLCTNDDCIPMLSVDEAVTTISSEHHYWLLKMSWCWQYIIGLIDSNPSHYDNSESLTFRSKLMNAVSAMRSALGLDNIGHLHYVPVIHEDTVFLVTVRFLDLDQQIQGVNLKWVSFQKVLRKKWPSPAQNALVREVLNIVSFYRSSKVTLKRGLYLCYMKLCCSLNAIHVVVPNNLPSFLPHVFVRDNPDVTEEEWQFLKALDQNPDSIPSSNQIKFQTDISTAIHTLFHDLDIDSDIVPGHRLYHAEILKPNDQISVLLILPRPDDVCSAPSGNRQMVQSRLHNKCDTLPIAAFETIHLSTYQPEFFTAYCRLSIFLEHYLMVCQYQQRKCLLENDVRVYKTLHEGISQYQKKLDEIWKKSRWISRIASEARAKRINPSHNAVPLSRILAPTKRRISEDDAQKREDTDEENGEVSNRPQPGSSESLDRLYQKSYANSGLYQSGTLEVDNPSVDWSNRREKQSPSEMISVYTAYECDSNDGTPIHLTIQQNTTSTEVVKLVLEQVAKKSRSPSDSTEASNDSCNFCLVVVVGTRERRLKDNFALCRI
ncbi:hypothetical protein V3C99_019145 [Haemonchus contortus]